MKQLGEEATGGQDQARIRMLEEREVLLRRMAGVALLLGDREQADAGLRQADRLREEVRQLSPRPKEEPHGA